MSRLGCALAVAVLGGGGAAGDLETVLQDDALVLNRPEAQVRAATEQIAGLGADRLRITAGWATVSPAPDAREVPGAPFDPADPSTYDQERASWAGRRTWPGRRLETYRLARRLLDGAWEYGPAVELAG